MRQLLSPITLLLLLSISCCKKKPVTQSELSKLPPETQTGANTFGCLVNGKAFTPKGSALAGPIKQAYYQWLNGGYYLVLSADDRSSYVKGVSLFTDSLKIQEGDKIKLKVRAKGNASASYFKALSASAYEDYLTDGNNYLGELWIKKLDTINQIIAGTFWFDAKDADGKKVEVREGRFDMRYTR